LRRNAVKNPRTIYPATRLTTRELDYKAAWQWDIGTRVRIGSEQGTVTKENATTVQVRWDSGRVSDRVPMDQLERL